MMTEQTIVAVYDKLTDADAAVRDLEAASVPSQAISRHEGRTEMTTATSAPIREEGFWARLFGSERTTTHRSMTAALIVDHPSWR
jgi:hypothetical protein